MSSSKDNLTNLLDEDLENYAREHRDELDKIEVHSRKEVFGSFLKR